MISQGFITNDLIYATGATLVHTLWQGMIVALILAVLLKLVPRKNAQLKYWMSITALCAMVFWSGYTFTEHFQISQDWKSLVSATEADLLFVPSVLEQPAPPQFTRIKAWVLSMESLLYPYMPTLVVVWALGMTLFLIRLQGSLLYLRHMRQNNTRSVPGHWQRKVTELTSRLEIRKPVLLLESGLAQVPMVIGHLKPVILLPVGLLTGLPAKDIEAIIAHELAHVKRFDYLINIVQTVVESILFFNPFVWWISRSIRKQREHCCDDLAVRCCGSQMVYANALTNLGAWSLNTPAMSMGLFRNRNELFHRIKRLVYPQLGSASIKEKLIPAGILVLTLLCVTWYSHKVQAQWNPTPEPQQKALELPPVPDPEPEFQVFPIDTLPDPYPEDELPHALPPLPDRVEEPFFSEDLVKVLEDLEDLEVVIPSMADLHHLDLQFDFDIPDVLMAPGELKVVLEELHLQLNDTTRKKIEQALRAQRQALDQAREEQARALQKAREQLRKSLEQGRPDDLSEEEWEWAKQEIRRAERSLERAFEQSERALERALQQRQFEVDVERQLMDQKLRLQEQMERMESLERNRLQREEERFHREMERHRRLQDRSRIRERSESVLRDHLLEDGLITNRDDDLHLVFKNDMIKINGKKLQGHLKEKYRDLLDEIYGSNSSGELEFTR